MCTSLKQDLYVKTALELLFYPQIAHPPSHLETLHEMDGIQRNRVHEYWRKKRGKSLYLPIKAGAGKLEKLSVELHHEPGYMSEEPVWRNAVPDPFDWAYFSTVR